MCRAINYFGGVEDSRGRSTFVYHSPYNMIEDGEELLETINVSVVDSAKYNDGNSDIFYLEEGARVEYFSVILCSVPYPRSCVDINFVECSMGARFPSIDIQPNLHTSLRSEARQAAEDTNVRDNWEEGVDDLDHSFNDSGWTLVRRLAPMPFDIKFPLFKFTGKPLGIHFAPKPDNRGAVVKSVRPGSRAHVQGVKIKMQLFSVNGVQCEDWLLTEIMKLLRDSTFVPFCAIRFRQSTRYHQAEDDIAGRATYGLTPGDVIGQGDLSKSEHSFSVPFDNVKFDQIMFATGDGSKWIIIDHAKLTVALDQARLQKKREKNAFKLNLIAERSHIQAYSHPINFIFSLYEDWAPAISVYETRDPMFESTPSEDMTYILYAEGNTDVNMADQMDESYIEDVQGLNVWIRRGESGRWVSPF